MRLTGRAKEIIKRIRGDQVVVEVGSETGATSAAILDACKEATVYAVDQWRPLTAQEAKYYLGSRRDLPVGSEGYWDSLKQKAIDGMSFAGDRGVVVEGKSVEVAREFADQSVDLAFIDAEHSYGAVKADIEAWLPKINPGGWLGGHDYGAARFPGVAKAVDDTLGVSVTLGLDSTWWYRIPREMQFDHKVAIASLISHGAEFHQGACVLGRSLVKHAPDIPRVLMVEEGQYSGEQIAAAERSGWQIRIVPAIRSQPAKFSAERWPYTFTKLNVWNLTEFDRVFYLDADCCVHSPHFLWLFKKDFVNLMACHVKTPANKRFNAGVMMVKPDANLFAELRHEIETKPSKETDARLSDQGFLNRKFRKFTLIADKYNQRDWTKPRPGVIISHLRPHPWRTDVNRKSAIIPYLNEWKRFATQTE